MVQRIIRLVVCSVLACSNSEVATIELTESAQTEVEGAGALGTVTDLVGGLGFSGFTDMNISESEELVNQGVQPGDISFSELAAFSLAVIEPDGEDLSFIGSMEIWVEAEGLEAQRVAYQDNFPVGATEVVFALEETDITDYILSETMTITTDVTGTLPEKDLILEAEAQFRIGVTAQGACNALSK